MAAEHEEFGLAGGEGGEYGADAVLFFGGGVELLGRGVAANDGE